MDLSLLAKQEQAAGALSLGAGGPSFASGKIHPHCLCRGWIITGGRPR